MSALYLEKVVAVVQLFVSETPIVRVTNIVAKTSSCVILSAKKTLIVAMDSHVQGVVSV